MQVVSADLRHAEREALITGGLFNIPKAAYKDSEEELDRICDVINAKPGKPDLNLLLDIFLGHGCSLQPINGFF